jgi:hypothetical protein
MLDSILRRQLQWRHTASTIPGHVQAKAPRIVLQDGAEFETSQILNSRWVGNTLQYYVRFKGRPRDEDSWVARTELDHWPGNKAKIAEFHTRNPDAWSPTHRLPSRAERAAVRGG